MDFSNSGKGVLWDMDGVLVDTGEYHFQSWVQTFSERGVPFDRENFRATFGMNNALILETILGEKPETALLEEISGRKESLFRDAVKGSVRPLPGVMDWLERLKNNGFKQAVASSAPPANIDALVDELGIRPYFDALVSGYDIPGKPNPDVFLKAANSIGVPVEACVVVEDAIPGVTAAKRAGMKCIAVTTTNPAHALAAAEIVVDRLDALSWNTFIQLLEKTEKWK